MDWQLSLKVVDQPKSTFHFPEMMPGDVPPGEYRVATLKQLVAAQLPDSVNDPDLIGQFNNPPSRATTRVGSRPTQTMLVFLTCSI